MSKIIETLRKDPYNYNIIDTEVETIKTLLVAGNSLYINLKEKPDEWNIDVEGEWVNVTDSELPIQSKNDADSFIQDYREAILEGVDESKFESDDGFKAGGFEKIIKETEQKWVKPEVTKQLVKTKPIPASIRDRQVNELELSDIRDYICPQASESEAYMFLKLCKARNLNPFTGEAYLIKYGNQKAQTVVGKETFTRRAELNPNFDGFEAGIIVKNQDGEIERRIGTFKLKEETLLGGWAKVYRSDKKYSFISEVSLDEYIGKKSTGETNSMWLSKQATMIRKTALVQALREAFPSEFSGMCDVAEFGGEVEASF